MAQDEGLQEAEVAAREPKVPALVLIAAVLGFVVLLILMLTPVGQYGSAPTDQCPAMLESSTTTHERCEVLLERRTHWVWLVSLPTLVAAIATVVRWPRRIYHPDGSVSWM